jgi:hypothetical protein
MNRKGTSLIELIIAIDIIITGILTVVGLIVRSINLGSFAKNKLIAVSLAQEGIEAVRSIRDSNIYAIQSGLADVDFNTGLNRDLTLAHPGDSFYVDDDETHRYDFTGVPVYNFAASGAQYADSVLNSPWSINFNADDFIAGAQGTELMLNQPEVEMSDVNTIVRRDRTTGLYYQGPDNGNSDTTPFKRFILLEPVFDNYGGCLLCRLTGTDIYTITQKDPPTLSNTRMIFSNPTVVGYVAYSKVQWKEGSKLKNILIRQDLYDWHL